jgi:dTDP-glucose 4,6-dehydratase
VEEYGNVREPVRHQHDFDGNGGLILHERSPINPKSIYATAKVAADFLTMNYHDAYGVPGVVTRMFNN